MENHLMPMDHDACGVGFVSQLGSTGSHEVVERALEALKRLAHRGGVDADGRSGDGAGLLTSIPERFIRKSARQAGIELPPRFGLGMVFLPRSGEGPARDLIEAHARRLELQCLGWRTVPTDSSIVGPRATETLPLIRQCFFAPLEESAKFEDILFRLRKEVEADAPRGTYFCSLSSRTVVYKGLLTPDQLPAFYPDLADPEFESRFAIFHQRYSTNTQPSWSLAQPFRFVAHNGEINTISANRRWLRARQPGLLQSLGLRPEVRVLEEGVSDSASFDNGMEVFLRRGYSPAEAMLCMVPPAWESAPNLSLPLRQFLEDHARKQEAWDGPAALIFTDGFTVGAKLDRNGLRPLRYTLTSDGLLVVGSEVGIAHLHDKQVVERQRLGPGEILLVNSATGEFLRPAESLQFSSIRPVSFPVAIEVGPTCRAFLQPTPEPKKAMAALGWSEDQFRLLFQPLVEQGQEAVWSMGDDTPPASLSSMRRPLWDYCKQRFAQVTNPPIDSLRESHVMSLKVFLGESITLNSPLLDPGQLLALEQRLAQVRRIDFTFPIEQGLEGAETALSRIQAEAQSADSENTTLVILSDRGVDAQHSALPALLALAAVWKSILQAGSWQIPLVIETGQVIDTHHIALLVAAGASAVFPYFALENAVNLRSDGASRYRASVEKGLRKVIARMGISTLASYRNSQLFETIGLDADLCAQFFEDASSTLGGKGLSDLLQDCLERHRAAFAGERLELHDAGLYRFRHNGERHSSSPELVRRMHRYIKSPSDENYRAFTELQAQREPVAVRDLLEVALGAALPLDDVESEASVLSRFSTQAMSLGAVSPETHRALAIAMNRLGGRSNTGEGGEDPEIYRDGGEANNRVKQVASARFGVTAEYLVHADELEIKIAQGAKPGEGGQLPASKVSVYIARLRHAVPNMSLISPPPHHDIYSIEDLAQLIYDLRAVNPRARIGVKLVSSAGVGIIATGVAKAGADVITISGYDGGTGASPITSIKNTGLPWEVGLRDAHSALVRTGLRARVRLRVDGGFKFARDVIVGALLGADEFGFGTAALLAIGCVMARQCHLNTCPVGIATQDEKLRARFAGRPEMVETYFRGMATEVRELLAGMGARSIDEIVGDVHRLKPRTQDAARSLGRLLEPVPDSAQRACPREDDSRLHLEVNRTVDELDMLAARPHHFRITNADRAIGAHLSGELLRHGSSGTPVNYEFIGSAGQSFAAFLISGLNFRLLGEANDYVGKGLCGGTVAITAGRDASLRGDVLAGNTVLYGATSGELYIAGRAGERFAVRNSGALAVVEGVGQHACEYMTAGVTVILGPAGTNLGAGMTGGLTYLLRDSIGGHDYNQQSVRLAPIEVREELWLRCVLDKHLRLTDSPRAAHLLNTGRPLSFLRVEPVQPPCTIAETWAAILGRLKRPKTPVPMELPRTVRSEEPVLM
jgi:glutamate synthase domain-containing protein 2/glutamate synthase domain-containing protein 1/glutamate synthase domain-containing protein 3